MQLNTSNLCFNYDDLLSVGSPALLVQSASSRVHYIARCIHHLQDQLAVLTSFILPLLSRCCRFTPNIQSCLEPAEHCDSMQETGNWKSDLLPLLVHVHNIKAVFLELGSISSPLCLFSFCKTICDLITCNQK